MRIITLVIAILAIFSCTTTHASYYENCYLDGHVIAASKATSTSSKIEFLVRKSVAGNLKERSSYHSKACQSHIGKTIKMTFRTKQKTQYTVGKNLKIRQVVNDALTSNGMETVTRWEVVNP